MERESEYFSNQKVSSYFKKISEEDGNNSQQMKIDAGKPHAETELDAGHTSNESRVLSKVTSILSVSNLVGINQTASSANLISNTNPPSTPVASGVSNRDRNTSTTKKTGNITFDQFSQNQILSPKATSKKSKRPSTIYFTNDQTISTPSKHMQANQNIDDTVLNDLNLDMLDLQSKEKESTIATEQNEEVTPSWRLKERMKTVGVGLILALNIGTDPPDVVKPNPCAKLQCWMDPTSTSRSKALLKIGELLEAQYQKWQGQQRTKLKTKKALDPTVDDVRNVCNSLRRMAKSERVLLHYNGSGVPRPTLAGEIWLFDMNHTQYIPFPVTDLKRLIGTPSLIVLDCNGAATLLPQLVSQDGIPPSDKDYAETVKNIIVLCPTAETENLPMNPDLPADLFTCCLTTPIEIALRWFIRQNPLSCNGLEPECVEKIPGKLNDRKTPLGELNWIFTAITDTIAWNVLPTSLFQSLFRQDLMVASMFRNFLLADRILRELNCTPSSYPSLPNTCNHPLWQAWDLAIETCLSQLIREGLLGNNFNSPRKSGSKDEDNDEDSEEENRDLGNSQTQPRLLSIGRDKRRMNKDKVPNIQNVSSPFFAEQLTSFEKWLEYAFYRMKRGGKILSPPFKQHENYYGMERMASFMYPGISQTIEVPEQLPVVLQVLLSPVYRVRALVLLRKFLNLGPSAVNLALSVGICPYVLRLLQSPINEYKHLLVGIWSKILIFDNGCKHDLVKDGALPHFIRHLNWDAQDGMVGSTSNKNFDVTKEDEPPHQRTMAAVILSTICANNDRKDIHHKYATGQTECLKNNLHGVCYNILKNSNGSDDVVCPAGLRMWLCICLGLLCKNHLVAQNEAFKIGLHLEFFNRMNDLEESSDVRASACFALGCLITISKPNLNPPDTGLGMYLSQQSQPSLNFFPGNSHQASSQSALPWQQQQQPAQIFSPLAGNRGQMPMMSPLSSGQQNPLSPQLSSGNISTHPFDLDLMIMEKIVNTTQDASPIVRFEACVVLGRLVRKFLSEFVSIAKKIKIGSFKDAELEPNDEAFLQAWKVIRAIHENDPHPRVEAASSSILRFVNERILEEEQEATNKKMESRIQSDINLAAHESPSASPKHLRTMSAVNLGGVSNQHQKQNANLESISEVPSSPTLSRSISTTSAFGTTGTFLFAQEASMPTFQDSQTEPTLQVNMRFHNDNDLPVSKFYEWKKELFEAEESVLASDRSDDPLSEENAIALFNEQRNSRIDQYSQKISKKYESLRPIQKRRKGGMLEDYDEPNEEEAALEAEIASKKKELNLRESAVLSYDGTKMTRLLRFHAYDTLLAASDGAKNISIWDTKNPNKKLRSISNGTKDHIKTTAMSWMNERNQSLLLVGCDDGSIRIHDNVCREDEPSVLATSFFGLPEMKKAKNTSKGSGLVTEWQQSEGRLIVGGTSPMFRCWDLTAEKSSAIFNSQVENTCCTSFVTAWDYVHNKADHMTGSGFSGIGPDILCAGFGDGRIKIFDLRAHGSNGDSVSALNTTRRGRNRLHKEPSHKAWIVNVAYTHSPTKYEIVSGDVDGSIKFWDIRYSRPLRSIEIQRSAMTALEVHPKLPLLASGSDANFVQVCSQDGDTLQAFRHHDKLQGRRMERIGKVSALAFHPNSTMLAAGFTNDIISIYSVFK